MSPGAKNPRPATQAKPRTASSPGRPSKLEQRAWEIFSRSSQADLPAPAQRQRFREAVKVAETFDQLWRAR